MSESVLPRYRDWAEQLLKTGHAVLLPDSYGSRELGPQCRAKERRVLARRERVADVTAARQWLVEQAWVARERVSLIGWANGASAVLWAVRPQLASRTPEPDFRSAVAFYPDCRISAGPGWSARVPTLLLIGAKDDITSPPPASRWSTTPAAAARWRGSRSIPAPRTISTAPTAAALDRGRRRRRRSAATSAPTRTRARIRRSASRSGWRGDRVRKQSICRMTRHPLTRIASVEAIDARASRA